MEEEEGRSKEPAHQWKKKNLSSCCTLLDAIHLRGRGIKHPHTKERVSLRMRALNIPPKREEREVDEREEQKRE